MPLMMSVARGNTSYTVSNRDHLSKLAALLPERDRATVVADCKAVDAETLGQLHKAGFHLVSLVPNSHKVRGEMVSRAWTEHPEVDAWPVLESRPGEHRGDPPRLYRGHSYEQMAMIQVGQTEDEKPLLEGRRYRYLVVWSDVLAGKFDRGLPERLQRESEDFLTQHERVFAKGFACEKDARSAANRLLRELELHTVEQEVYCEEYRVKPDKPGRPRMGAAPQTETLWFVEFSLEPDAEAIAAARRELRASSSSPTGCTMRGTTGGSSPSIATSTSSKDTPASDGSRAPPRSRPSSSTSPSASARWGSSWCWP